MKTMLARWVLAAAVLGAGGVAFGQQQAGHGAATTKAADGGADAALALRFSDMGNGAERVAGGDVEGARYAAALYEAAGRLDAKTPRYLRRAGMIAASVGDVEDALRLLVAYARVDPADRVVFSKIVELYAARMETAEAKIKYLTQMASEPKVPEEVRSTAAVLCAKVMLDRGERDQAIAMLGQAVRYNPMDGEALRMRFELLGRSGTAYERGVSLLSMVRADPANPQLVGAMAEELASVGLGDDAVNWYGLAAGLYQRDGATPDVQFATGYGAQLYRLDKLEAAQQWADAAAGSGDSEALFLKLVIDKTAANKVAAKGEQGPYEKTLAMARNALTARMAYLAKAAGDEKATTQPTAAGDYVLPDVVGLAERVIKSGNAALVRQYAADAGDLAWFLIYFDRKPGDAAKVMQGLKKVAGPGAETDPVIVRLEGWSYLVDGRKDEAKVKLSAVADREPLAAMGVVELALAGGDDNAKRQAEQTARKLVSEHTTGALGATLWEGLRSAKVQVVAGKSADGLTEELKKFPIGLLAIGQQPEGFYVLRVEPTEVSYAFGQPMTAKVTLQNLSDMDLTLGPDGVIKPGVWIEPSLRGNVQQLLAATWVDAGWGQVVLRGRQAVTKTVRLDRGALGDVLAESPDVTLVVSGTAVTNGLVVPQRGIAPGAAGYRVQFTKFCERTGLGVNDAAGRSKVMAAASGEGEVSGTDRMRAMEGIAQYVLAARRAAVAGAQAGGAVGDAEAMTKAIETSRSAQEPSVRAWATFLSGILASDAGERAARVDALAGDAAWQGRALAVVAARALGAEKTEEVAKRLAGDADATVKELARAAGEWAKEQGEASSRAATRPQ